MRALGIVALVLVLSGCASALRPLPTTVCHRPGVAEPADTDWRGLLTEPDEGRACSCGRALARTPAAPRCEGAAPVAPARLSAIAPRVVAVARRGGEDDVVWVATHRTADGSVSGPIAIVRRTSLGLEVQALGAYAGPAEGVRPRLLRAGQAVVVAIERADGADRVADLLVQSGGALVPAALEDPAHGCDAPARIVLARTSEAGRSRGWRERRVESATIDEGADVLVVREHLSVVEVEEGSPDAPPRARRDSDRMRTLTPVGARLRADRGPIGDDAVR